MALRLRTLTWFTVAMIVLFLVMVALDLNSASNEAAYAETTGDSLMHSQRLGKASPNAVQGNPEAFRQLEESRKELNQDFQLMQSGGTYQGLGIGSPGDSLAAAVAAARAKWVQSDKSADTISANCV